MIYPLHVTFTSKTSTCFDIGFILRELGLNCVYSDESARVI